MAVALMPTFQVQAWIGGPWSNNSFQENGDDGIYEAVGSLTDGTAMYRWAVHNENPGGQPMVGGQANAALTSNVQFGGLIGSQNPHVIWYRGLVYYGRCFGLVNSDMKTVLVTGNASTTGLNGNNGQMNGVSLNIGDSQLNIGGGGNNITAVVPARKTLANSTFRARLDKYSFSKRFHGHGTISFVGNPDFDLIVIEDFDIIIGDGSPVTIVPLESRSSDSSFLPEGHRVGMKIFGNRVSTVVNG